MKIRSASLFLGFAGVSLGALIAGCGSAASSIASSDSDLIGGREAADGEFPATLLIKDDCSAAKVGPRKILTAAHCVDAHLSVGNTIELTHDRATGAFNMQEPTWQSVAITAVDVAPSWLETCTGATCAGAHAVGRLGVDDVAIITVDQDISGEEAAVDLKPVKTGDQIFVVGYGCEETVGGSWDYKNQRLRVAETVAMPVANAVHPGSYLTDEDVASGLVSKQAAVDFATPGPDYTLVEGWRNGSTVLTADGGDSDGGAVLSADSGAISSDAGDIDAGPPVAPDTTHVGGLCPGDSGGPVFRRAGKSLAVVGVNSSYTFVRGDEYTYDGLTFRYGGAPATNLHARVDANNLGKWLKGLGVSISE